MNTVTDEQLTPLDRIVRFCIYNKLVVILTTIMIVVWGVIYAPFDWETGMILRDPVAVDAIPDIGENQQIVFAEWPGRSPQDIENQVSYPLTVALLGIPGVKTVRSYSDFGFSSIYVIFRDDVEFYWSRSRIVEKLNALAPGTLPENVAPMLGPDATGLGQVFWYTLEGRDEGGRPTGGWDLEELRSVQDWTVRYALLSAEGISEVAGIGGFVREYQIDVDPDAMRAHGVTLDMVFAAVKDSNIDVGARTIEINKVEYIVRGLGFIKDPGDIEMSVVKTTDNVPLYVKDVADVVLGPAVRRGALDKEGVEAVGGVAVVRYGENPLAAIKNLKKKIAEISPGLPRKALVDFGKISPDALEEWARERGFDAFRDGQLNREALLEWATKNPVRPEWLTVSQVGIVPFYDRTDLIHETLGTLSTALRHEILITTIVVIVMIMHLGSSLLISGMLPLAVLMCFIGMKIFGVDANVVALSGIAIAIGTIVDMGIVLCENILRHMKEAAPGESGREVVFRATREVASAVVTAIATTVIGFLPVFTMEAAEGKLFRPLAYTKTFALIASVAIALTIVPSFAHMLFGARTGRGGVRKILALLMLAAGLASALTVAHVAGTALAVFGAYRLLRDRLPAGVRRLAPLAANTLVVLAVGVVLTRDWMPLGVRHGEFKNILFVFGVIGLLLGSFRAFGHYYAALLKWFLEHKTVFFLFHAALLLFGASVWLGVDRVLFFVPDGLKRNRAYSAVRHALPGLGKEFMPPLDEGSFLYMPTTMPHASIGEALDVLQKIDGAMAGIPEVEQVVGKLGRADSPLDPAPVSMIETVVNYKSEYLTGRDGTRQRFKYDPRAGDVFRDAAGRPILSADGTEIPVEGRFVRDSDGGLVPDPAGREFRQWRPEIARPDDIWKEIVRAAEIPGTTSAPKLQPIATRIVMLQSGMRAPMGVKVKGPSLEVIEKVGIEIEALLKQVPSVEAAAVIADRVVGKPYLEIDIDRTAIARYGVRIRDIQDVIEVAIGGRTITSTVEGRERYPVRVRYKRELRDRLDTLEKILVPGASGVQIPLAQLAEIRYVRGPQMIRSEDTFLTSYVLFDKQSWASEVDVVEACRNYLDEARNRGELVLPSGVSYAFAGSYENQVRSEKRLMLVLPLTLFTIFMILYLQFKKVSTALMVFSEIVVAGAGGFTMIWLFGRAWFLDFSVLGSSLREVFQVGEINLSVAVWVGFIALFGIASDDGVVMATYLDQSFAKRTPQTVAETRAATIAAGKLRIGPCLMTSATTLLALLAVLTSTGRGSDVMIPMAIPIFGGMVIELFTLFAVPVLYASWHEFKIRLRAKKTDSR